MGSQGPQWAGSSWLQAPLQVTGNSCDQLSQLGGSKPGITDWQPCEAFWPREVIIFLKAKGVPAGDPAGTQWAWIQAPKRMPCRQISQHVMGLHVLNSGRNFQTPGRCLTHREFPLSVALRLAGKHQPELLWHPQEVTYPAIPGTMVLPASSPDRLRDPSASKGSQPSLAGCLGKAA